MDTVHLSWQNEKRHAEFTQRPGQMLLVVDRLHHVQADAEGRLLGAILGPSTWRRSYADKYVEIHSEVVEEETFHIPHAVGPHEAMTFMLRVRSQLIDARAAAERQGEAVAAEALDRILAWEADLLADDGQRFRKIYPKVGPLPPDQQSAIVLQPRADFAAHVRDALGFLGKARAMRKGIYLDGLEDSTQLRSLLPAAAESLPGEAIAAAIPRVGEEDPAALAAAGLSRVYVPVEGLDERGVSALREAKVTFALLAPAPADLDDADALAIRVNALPLEGIDTVYVLEPQPYPYDAARRMAIRRAFHHFRGQLRFPDHPAGPVVSHYPILQAVF